MAPLAGATMRWILGAVVLGVVLLVVVLLVRSDEDPQVAPRESPSAAPREAQVAPSESPSAAPRERPAQKPVAVDLDRLRPQPGDALDDRPALYEDPAGCQVKDGNPVPVICTSGDESADRTLMLVGDSKIAQWETAYSDLGRAGGWQVATMTKSACPFMNAAVTAGRKVKADCRAWGRAALTEILAAKPDVVVTSQRADTALLADGSDRTRGAMIRGLHDYWSQLLDAGIEVVVHLDNPFPTTHPVYECVQDHPDDVGRCAFDLDKGLVESAAPELREAAETLPGVRIVDMTSAICPDGVRCPAVMGDVLLYRAGSHLTRTFVVSIEQALARELALATDGAFS